jgi:protein involved in polysaccharide export with SLBB domain
MRAIRFGPVFVLLLSLACAAQDQQLNPYSEGYLIRIGDELRITVHSEPNLSGWVRVRSDGNIVIRPIGLIRATGQTIEQLRSVVAAKLAKFVETPQVQIEMGDKTAVPSQPRKWLFPPDPSAPYPLPEPSGRS